MVMPVPAVSPPVPPPPYSPAPPPPLATATQGEFGAFDSLPPRPLAKPVYTPPVNQPGEPTELIGGPEGWQFQVFDRERRPVLGFRHAMGSWGNQPAVAEFTPLFDRTAHAGGADLVLAREGYAVGSLEVVAEVLVNAVRVHFVRLRPDGTLDKSDAYLSDWIGNPAGKTPREIGDGVMRVIGICGRHGTVKNALALILDKGPAQVAASTGPTNRTGSDSLLSLAAPPANAPRKRSGVPVYEPPPGQPGRHTELAGGPEGWQFQAVDQGRRAVVGFRFRMGSWAREPAVARFDPLYQRDEPPGRDSVVMGHPGYVVGGLQVVAGDLVNAVRITFVRERTNGSLDKSDFYLSDWIGDPGDDKPQVFGDGQTRVIGICGRNGAVKNAIALVLDKP